MSPPVARAHSTLGWAAILLAVTALLVERARGDIDDARDELLDERNRRLDAEDSAEKLRSELDGALEALHAKMPAEARDVEP